jgi:hypothetical protein
MVKGKNEIWGFKPLNSGFFNARVKVSVVEWLGDRPEMCDDISSIPTTN